MFKIKYKNNYNNILIGGIYNYNDKIYIRMSEIDYCIIRNCKLLNNNYSNKFINDFIAKINSDEINSYYNSCQIDFCLATSLDLYNYKNYGYLGQLINNNLNYLKKLAVENDLLELRFN